MAEIEYPDDIQFAGLVQAATAAADEQTRTSTALGKRKRLENDGGNDSMLTDPNLISTPSQEAATDESIQLQNSATVLFREPSMKSKKYSRPPLGKVYASLELAPENFLRLQAAGKEFMLDPQHPERRDVVGNKKHSEGNDVAKLKLWNCVEEFLYNEGYGERFFGHGAGEGIPGAPVRTMFWPEEMQQIIKLCMPLMRKMVTNERQRIYAAETRKQTPGQASDQEVHDTHNDELKRFTTSTRAGSRAQQNGETKSPKDKDPSSSSFAQVSSGLKITPAGSVVVYVNLVTPEGNKLKRVIPRFSLPSESAMNLASLMEEVKKRFKTSSRQSGSKASLLDQASIKVWMSDGLVPINDDGEWMVTLLSAGDVEWMDGEVRVLVQV